MGVADITHGNFGHAKKNADTTRRDICVPESPSAFLCRFLRFLLLALALPLLAVHKLQNDHF